MKKRLICALLILVLVASCLTVLTACKKDKVIMLWGPEEQREVWLKYANQFKEANADAFKGYVFDYAGSGDAGAYGNMSVDPTKGAAIYSFANDQMANLANLNALSPLAGSDLEWSQTNNIAAAVEATKMGDKYMAYPLQADNGFFMFYNKQYFVGTSVWDATKDDLKEGYTMRDLYAALEENSAYAGDKTKIMWPANDSWYISGIFFGVGGDYEVTYDAHGKQQSASCNFAYTLPEGVTDYNKGDFTVGYAAVQAIKNTYTNADGTINAHFLYPGNTGYNDLVSYYTDPNGEFKDTPMVATINGTWKASELKERWGDNYRATVLPMVEDDAGNKYAWKTFAGYKHLGVNPLCEFVADNPSNIEILHKLAQYLSSKEIQVERYNGWNAGPSNKEALEDDAVKADVALKALNAQYDRVCVYPASHALAGQSVGNGLGFRVQDSVPANYWTPIQNFGANLYVEYEAGKLDAFSAGKLKRTLATLQYDIEAAAQ